MIISVSVWPVLTTSKTILKYILFYRIKILIEIKILTFILQVLHTNQKETFEVIEIFMGILKFVDIKNKPII